MAIKNTDGTIELSVSAPSDKVFLGGIQLAANIIKGITTTPMVYGVDVEAETDKIDCTFENNSTLEAQITKGKVEEE